MKKVIKYYNKHGLKSTFKRIQRSYYKAIRKEYIPITYGLLMYANWEDFTFNLIFYGKKENILSNFIASINHEFLFLDIGAHQGFYSLLAANKLKCLKVIAFEPVSDTFSLLKKNISANKFQNKVVPIKAAISSENGFSEINLKKGHSGAASLRKKSGKDYQKENIKLINIAEVDNLVPSNSCKIIVKIDVEGYENVVIDELLKSKNLHNISAIFYEISEFYTDPVAIQNKLQMNGFYKFEKYGTGNHYDILALK